MESLTQESKTAVPYTEEQATHWLSWLAQGMQKHSQTVFQVEQLQPTWLDEGSELIIYLLITRLLWAVVAWLASGTVLQLGARVLGDTEISNIFLSLFPCLVWGLFMCAIDVLRFLTDIVRFQKLETFKLREGAVRTSIILLGTLAWVVIGFFAAVFLGVFFFIEFIEADDVIYAIWLSVILYGLIWMLRSFLRPPDRAIQPVEMLRWSWRGTFSAGCKGSLLGVGGLIIAIPIALGTAAGEPFIAGVLIVAFTLILTGFGAIVGGLFGGFVPGLRELKSVPNQGIRLSLRYALLTGVAAGVIVALVAALITRSPLASMGYGIAGGFCFGMWFGGLEVAEHFVIRLIMAVRDHAPLRYVPFLDYAAEDLQILQKVGGGYMFIHRYMLEYFAGLEE